MGPKPLVGCEIPEVAEDWLERMESCFHVFDCSEDQKMEAATFLLEGHAHKWWRSASAPLLQKNGWLIETRRAREVWVGGEMGSMTVDEYQQKFINLLPYCPHIGANSKAKYDHFLQGLNQDIFNWVDVCDDPTSYEGLDASVFSTRESLGPRAQSFKKFASTNSSSGSGGVMRFAKKGQCAHCGKNHPMDKCHKAAGACFHFEEIDHLKKNCPQAGVQHHKLPYIALDVVIYVSTPTGQSALGKCLVLGCLLEFEGNVLIVNLMVLSMEDFDCILGIDMLTTYRASVDCYPKLVRFHSVGDDSWFFYGEGSRSPMPLIFALRVCRALESSREGYLIYAVDMSTESVVIGYFPVVNEFPDVFPDEIPGFSPVREVEFVIELIPGTSPIL
ncbi:uncharacterized protein [Henckelia pumila]|uniref:uncharacterized protein n=1 Tax=Henckelia pumila TaxID=405737 RepID=UPI003C6E8E2D